MKKRMSKRIISSFLAVLIAFGGIIPAMSAFAANGVEGYYDIELAYKDTDTLIPTYIDDTSADPAPYVEYMTEGDELSLTYKLIDTAMPDNSYIKWYSETPTLVDVDQNGLVKAFDSSKGAVIRTWIDNEVKTVPLVGSILATILEKALFNDTVNVDTMDTDAIVAIVEVAFGSDSLLDKWIESYRGELIDSLRYYLDHINSNIHVQLCAGDGTVLDDDYVQIVVQRSNEWYANFLPNGTHITNKSQINTTVAVGSTVQLYAVTTPVRLEYGVVYSVKSSSIFDKGKVVATVDDSGLVTFKNTGKVTIMVSPDTEQVIQNILALINKFYEINGEMIDSDKVAEILIKYVGLDINRNVLAAILDACFAIADIAGGAADPVKLTATAAKLIGNLVMQFKYNDTITFNVVEAQPLTDFKIDGPNEKVRKITGEETIIHPVQEGAQIQLEIIDIVPEIGDTSDITWRSSDPSIASIDSKTGVVTGRDAGASLGAISMQTCTIYAVSAANNIERSYEITVRGKAGNYISDADIVGDMYLEMGEETDFVYTVYPKRVASSNYLYASWGLVTGEDEEGNTTYAWADAENPAVTEFASIDAKGHYTVLGGGECEIALQLKTGYYLSNGKFFEISSLIKTAVITNGIPVERIVITPTSATSNGSLSEPKLINVEGNEYTYTTVYKSVAEGYLGNGAVVSAQIYPENASNQNLKWVVDNGYYESSVSDDTHTATVKQKAAHEVADTFNIYAVSEDGTIKSNVVTVTVTRNRAIDNKIVGDNNNEIENIDIIRGRNADAKHKISFDGSWTSTAYACYKCNWYSTDESVFTVETLNNDNRDARITGVDVGTATLVCVSADGGIEDTCQVTVYPDKDYLRNIVNLCDNTVIIRTKENASLYKTYMNKLDLAYYVLYDEPMASQTVCDTYADELLTAFYRLGGFVGISGINILDKDGNAVNNKFIRVNVDKIGLSSDYTKYSYDFDYSILPKTAMYSNVKWTSSDANVIVDRNGKCKPKSNDACSAKITCTVYDYMGDECSASVYISFARTEATGVTLDKESIAGGKIGETQQLKATVSPTGTVGAGVGSASCKDVFWTSSDSNIAKVSNGEILEDGTKLEPGTVTFVEGGDCIITATTYDGGYTAQCAVNVVTNYTALTLLYNQYNDLELNSDNYYPDSWEFYTKAMSKAKSMLESNDSSQKEVNNMYAELETAYKSLRKYNYLTRIELYLDGEATKDFYQYNLGLLTEGFSYKNAELDLNVRLYPNNASYNTVEWVSSNPEKISVSSDGKCKPTANESCYGMISCTVTDHFGNAFTDSVWVSFAYTPVTELKLSEYNIAGEIGASYPLKCTVYPTGSSLTHVGAASIQDYYWESDDESVATVDENGLVTFVSTGATIIRAVSYDGGISAECLASTNGDRTALIKALNEYKDVELTDYVAEYSALFKAAYENAERALTDYSYTQQDIDDAANRLIEAYNNMLQHPYVKVQLINLNYASFKDPTLAIKPTQMSSGTIGDNDAVSVHLTSSYADYCSNNYITITPSVYPADAMYKSIEWNVDSSEGIKKLSVDNGAVTVTPSERKTGGWAILTVKLVDDYNREFTRTIYVTLSKNVCTGIDITESSRTVYADADVSAIPYTLSGSPEFKNVIWSSSNTDVVTVDENGNIKPVEKGSAVITAKTIDGGYSDTIEINVQTNFSNLASKYDYCYEVIQESQIGYTYTEASLNNLIETAADAKLMLDEKLASQTQVNEMIERLEEAYNSLIFYIPVESVDITFEEADNVTSANKGFITYSGLTINRKSINLKPVFNDENAEYAELKWSSSNPDITVDENTGVVTNTSASAGFTRITCTVTNVFNKTCSADVYVAFSRYAASGISFNDEMVFGAPANTVALAPKIENSANITSGTMIVKDCIYTSDNPDIASVDQNGVVTFLTQGVTTITAVSIDGGFTAAIQAYTTWDTTALKAAMEDAEKLVYTDYAYDYGMAFKSAYENAQVVYANVYAEQNEIDNACSALTEAITQLNGHEFVKPVISLVQNETELSINPLVQVDTASQSTEINLVLNDGAMVSASDIIINEENGVSAAVNGSTISVTKTAEKGNLVVTVEVIDDYGRKYTKSYSMSIIDTVVLVTDITLTVDGAEAGASYVKSCGGSYTKYQSFTIGYIPNPENANAITSVTYKSSADNYIKIDENGVVTLSALAIARSSYTSLITCTVENSDGTKVSKTINVTITRA
ncbi:MAG: Ig-like domain-containing protein [Acetobacter sp.]|nr:Ig-like domain-containing protein [Bacteroides sp.]MCM1341296.1 Ig-like domain-containing protein [Acetobacter sp.]MCM1433928.1 Ig-like domain-containing protein [Clostridiales bacterium]